MDEVVDKPPSAESGRGRTMSATSRRGTRRDAVGRTVRDHDSGGRIRSVRPSDRASYCLRRAVSCRPARGPREGTRSMERARREPATPHPTPSNSSGSATAVGASAGRSSTTRCAPSPAAGLFRGMGHRRAGGARDRVQPLRHAGARGPGRRGRRRGAGAAPPGRRGDRGRAAGRGARAGPEAADLSTPETDAATPEVEAPVRVEVVPTRAADLPAEPAERTFDVPIRLAPAPA